MNKSGQHEKLQLSMDMTGENKTILELYTQLILPHFNFKHLNKT